MEKQEELLRVRKILDGLAIHWPVFRGANMLKMNSLSDQIRRNCDISDAKHAGLFTVCGLALRLRDLYKWENRLEPWVEPDAAEILDWIEQKERTWETLDRQDYRPIRLFGETYDPFDTRGINRALSPCGLFYGAGYGRSLKPTFLLSRVRESKTVHGCKVVVLEAELARDLFTVPAFVQDGCIAVRTHTAKTFLWDRMLYINKSGKRALAAALKTYGLDMNRMQDLQRQLERITGDESEVYIRHEVGEMEDTAFDAAVWREIIAAYPHSPIELLARGIKDLLADTGTHGTFAYIVKRRRISSLAFYVAFMDGLPRKLFQGLSGAFEDLLKTGDWSVVEAAVSAGRRAAETHAEAMTRIFEQGKERNDTQWAQKEMARCLLEPLTT